MSESKQLKIVFPEHLYNILDRESKLTGNTMASLVRQAVAHCYRRPCGALIDTQDYLNPPEANLNKIPRYSEEEKVVELGFLAKYQEADEND